MGSEKYPENFTAIVVGREDFHNYRLFDLLQRTLGQDRVLRCLETHHLLEYLEMKPLNAVGVFLDICGFDPEESVNTISYVRDTHPSVVFCLYVDFHEKERYWRYLSSAWRTRFEHYFYLYKVPKDVEIEPVVRHSLLLVAHEAVWNIQRGPIRITPPEVVSLAPSGDAAPSEIFVSYAREDWAAFVSPLVEQLRDRGYRLWVDQHFLVGGEKWMDALGAALDACKLLVLVMSPASLKSKYVKMEYRYFFHCDKPIIPVMYKKIKHMPPELILMQHIDFSQGSRRESFRQLAASIDSFLAQI